MNVDWSLEYGCLEAGKKFSVLIARNTHCQQHKEELLSLHLLMSRQPSEQTSKKENSDLSQKA
jgi:hypothetical protein